MNKNQKILLLIFIISLGLRLVMFSKSKTFGTDQARDVLLIQNHFQNKKPIVLGPKASVGDFYLPPFYYYLISIPWLVSGGHPYSPTMLNILIESLTPVIIYLFVSKFWNQKAGIFASILYAISPLTIQYASFAWNPNVIPFFSISALYFLFDYTLNKKDGSLLVSLVLTTLSMQLHYQAFILYFSYIPVFIYSIIMQKRKVYPWIKAIGLSVITFLPLILDPTTSTQNIRNIINYFKNNHSQIYQTTFTFEFFWKFMSMIYSKLLGFRHSNYLFGRIVLFFGSTVIGLKALLNFVKEKKIDKNFLFITFVICSFIGLRVYKGDKWEYFLSFMYFVPAITFTISNQIIFKKKSIIIILIAAFVAGISFPLFTRTNQNNAIMITKSKEIVGQKYDQDYQIINHFEYYENGLKYLWNIDEHNQEKNNIIYICPPKFRCHLLACFDEDKPDQELWNMYNDKNYAHESWRVGELNFLAFTKIL